MAKYIDLLRAHQQHAAGKKTEEAPLPPAAETAPSEGLEELLQEEPVAASTDQPHELLPDELPTETVAKPSAPDHMAKSGESEEWLTDCIDHTLTVFNAASTNTLADITPLSVHLEQLFDNILAEPETVDTLELDISRHTALLGEIDTDLGSLVQKSIMMMLYAIKVGLQLRLQHQDLHTQTLAAMLHHIGMAQIPASIRNKKEQLSEEELQQIRQAPEIAHNYLQSCGVTDAAILQAAEQAQERHDGSGPMGLSGSEIAFSARIVSLLSMFEALIHYRPYRTRLLPRDAIRELVNHHKQSFDPAILKALIEAISLYPVGTYVQLNSGDIGQVIRVHQRLPLRPVIEVRYNDELHAIPPRKIDLKAQPNLMVKHCMYEENLNHLRKEPRKHA